MLSICLFIRSLMHAVINLASTKLISELQEEIKLQEKKKSELELKVKKSEKTLTAAENAKSEMNHTVIIFNYIENNEQIYILIMSLTLLITTMNIIINIIN